MINDLKLKARIMEKGYTQSSLAKMLGIRPETFYKKLKTDGFYTHEAERICSILDISPLEYFFTQKLT